MLPHQMSTRSRGTRILSQALTNEPTPTLQANMAEEGQNKRDRDKGDNEDAAKVAKDAPPANRVA
jgi:hypothetical protein